MQIIYKKNFPKRMIVKQLTNVLDLYVLSCKKRMILTLT